MWAQDSHSILVCWLDDYTLCSMRSPSHKESLWDPWGDNHALIEVCDVSCPVLPWASACINSLDDWQCLMLCGSLLVPCAGAIDRAAICQRPPS